MNDKNDDYDDKTFQGKKHYKNSNLGTVKSIEKMEEVSPDKMFIGSDINFKNSKRKMYKDKSESHVLD